jgi:hypothetical protein
MFQPSRFKGALIFEEVPPIQSPQDMDALIDESIKAANEHNAMLIGV